MYRLAHELGAFMLSGDISVNHNIDKEKYIEDIMPIVFSLPEDLQCLFKDITYACGKNNNNIPANGYLLDETIAKQFIECGLLIQDAEKNKKRLFNRYKVKDIREFAATLPSEELPNKKKDLINFILTNYPEVQFLPNVQIPPDDRLCVQLPDEISSLAIKIHNQLCNKFPREEPDYFSFF